MFLKFDRDVLFCSRPNARESNFKQPSQPKLGNTPKKCFRGESPSETPESNFMQPVVIATGWTKDI